jgi:hypothetical protein
MVMILDKAGGIVKGNIVQFIAYDDKVSEVLPGNTFSKIFTSQKLDCDGRFSFLTINDWLLYELKYEKGVVQSFGKVRSKPVTAGTDSRAGGSQCYAQYLITTVYYENGTTEVFEEYLGTFCTCTSGVLCDEFGGGAGSAGGECCIPDSTIQLSSVSVSESRGLDCSQISIDRFTGRETKTCTYTWEFNRNRLLFYNWSYISNERSVLEKINGVWKFKPGGVTHVGIFSEGTAAPCVSFDCVINSAIPFISADRTQARMNLIYVTTFNVSCCPACLPLHTTSAASA